MRHAGLVAKTPLIFNGGPILPYRWRSGDRKGQWKPTQREAIAVAILAGVAMRAEDGKVVWLNDARLETGDGRRAT